MRLSGTHFADSFGIERSVLEDYGAFNISLINDLPLFIDPFLLFNSANPDYQALHEQIIDYMRFLKGVCLEGHIPEPLLLEWFTFREVKQTWLGFSKVGNDGRGLGRDFAFSLSRNLMTAFRDFGEEQITAGSHLEKLCLLKDGVGRDNISDFTTNLIKGYLADYTQRFAMKYLREDQRRKVTLRKVGFNYHTRSWRAEPFTLPFIDGDFVLLTPRDVLTKDEAWINRSELLDGFADIADSLPDGALRAQVNDYLRRVIPQGEDVTKKEIRTAIAMAAEKFPEVLDYYIRDKEEDGYRAVSIAEKNVRHVENVFVDNVQSLVLQYLTQTDFYQSPGNSHAEALERIEYLKDVVENKGGHTIFYMNGQPVQREADLQVMYRLVWFATPSDVTREANDGRGPADFKISRGSSDKTIVEFKLAKNTQLKRNLEKQCAVYEAASDATHPSIKVIMFFNESEQERVKTILRDLKLENDENIVLIDARADNKPSGSRA